MSKKFFWAWWFLAIYLFRHNSWHDLKIRLKGATKSYFTHYSFVVLILFNTGLSKSAFSTNSFRKLFFLRFLSFLPVMCRIWCNLHKLYNICTIFVWSRNLCFCSHLWETVSNIKICVQFLIKNMPLKSFWTFKF